MKILQLLFGLVLFCTFHAEASIEWEKKEITVAVHPVQLKKEVDFKFRNTGNDPVELLSMRPSCSCISAHPEKKRYLPGESGTLKVVFDLSNRTGPQKKSVKIITSNNPDQHQILYLKIDIPEAYLFSTKRLLWESGPKKPTKTVILTNVSSGAISIGKVTSSDDRLKIEVKTLREGFEYRLELTPEAGLENTRSVIRIQTIPPDGMAESKSYKIYARIK